MTHKHFPLKQKKNRKFDFNQKRLEQNLDEEIEDQETHEQNQNYENNEEDMNVDEQSEDLEYHQFYHNQQYEDNCGFDLSIAKYDYDNNGYATFYLLDKLTGYSDPDYYQMLVDDYKRQTKILDRTVKNNYYVENLEAKIDFSNTCINDIQELAKNVFDLNNLKYIKLFLFIDELLEPKAIKFVQSVLNLQTLKEYYIEIIPKSPRHQVEYLIKIQQQLKFKSQINKQEISVYSFRKSQGFTLFSDEEKINKLFFDDFFPIQLDFQQLESVEILEINSDACTYLTQMNDFLKKLINLKDLKVGINSFKENEYYDYEETKEAKSNILQSEEYGIQQRDILQTISELQKIQKIQLDCSQLSPFVKQLTLQQQNLKHLIINLGNSIIPIHSSTLLHLDVTTLCYLFEEIDLDLFKQSSLNKLRGLKMNISFQDRNDESPNFAFYKTKRFDYFINQKLAKYFKKIVNLEIKTRFL